MVPEAAWRWDPVVDTSITAATGLLWLTLSAGVEPNLPVDPPPLTAVHGLDRLALGRWDPLQSRFSDLLIGGSLGAGLLVVGLQGQGSFQDKLPALGLVIESLTVSEAVASTLKHAVDRPRPYTLILDPPEEVREAAAKTDAYLSFPSGHTTMAASVSFATASILAGRGVKPVPAYLGAAAITTGVAFLRVGAGKHYPTDVLAGAAIGTAVGLSVPVLHRVRAAGNAHEAPPMGVFANPGGPEEAPQVGVTFPW